MFHNLSNIVIGLLDTRAHLIWLSSRVHEHCPADMLGYSADTHTDALARLSRCLIEQKSEAFVDRCGDDAWRITMLPVNHSEVGGVVVCSKLPPKYDQITDEDRLTLTMLADGESLRKVSDKLLLSDSGIDSRVRLLKAKLDARTIGSMVASAIRQAVI